MSESPLGTPRLGVAPRCDSSLDLARVADRHGAVRQVFIFDRHSGASISTAGRNRKRGFFKGHAGLRLTDTHIQTHVLKIQYLSTAHRDETFDKDAPMLSVAMAHATGQCAARAMVATDLDVSVE